MTAKAMSGNTDQRGPQASTMKTSEGNSMSKFAEMPVNFGGDEDTTYGEMREKAQQIVDIGVFACIKSAADSPIILGEATWGLAQAVTMLIDTLEATFEDSDK